MFFSVLHCELSIGTYHVAMTINKNVKMSDLFLKKLSLCVLVVQLKNLPQVNTGCLVRKCKIFVTYCGYTTLFSFLFVVFVFCVLEKKISWLGSHISCDPAQLHQIQAGCMPDCPQVQCYAPFTPIGHRIGMPGAKHPACYITFPSRAAQVHWTHVNLALVVVTKLLSWA